MKKLYRNIGSMLLLAFSFLSFAGLALASSYNTSYSFSVAVQGATRNFTGTNIAFHSPNATSTPFKHATNFYYSVALYRDNFLGDDYIGQASLHRDASGTAQWSNVGAGNYYVYLSKANDGVTLTDNNVTIYNY